MDLGVRPCAAQFKVGTSGGEYRVRMDANLWPANLDQAFERDAFEGEPLNQLPDDLEFFIAPKGAVWCNDRNLLG